MRLLTNGPRTWALFFSWCFVAVAPVGAQDAPTYEEALQERLRYHVHPLSYVQSDRALAVLKALGYTVTEFEAAPAAPTPGSGRPQSQTVQPGASLEQIFSVQTTGGGSGNGDGQTRHKDGLPRIIKILDAPKTSITDPAPGATTSSASQSSSRGPARAESPGLGGSYLHHTTSGEPLQRLLIEYDSAQPSTLDRLLFLLGEQIDVPARQIVIEAMVIEVNTDRVTELGVKAEYERNNTPQGEGAVAGQDNNYTMDGAFNQVVDGATKPFSFVLNMLKGSTDRAAAERFLGVELNALIKEGAAEVLSRPSVLALDGRQARIQIGQQVPVVSSNVSQGTIQGQISYSEVGITLNLRPRINQAGDEITMQVETIVSSVSAQSTGQNSTGTEIFRAPTFDSRRVESFVRVANNTPFIIGGLISTEKTESWTGVPVLSRIPLLGRLFRSTTTGLEKREVIVVLTPHVVRNDGTGLSYVIPKDTDSFNSIGNDLFRNAYRIRDDDVFDFSFVTESSAYLRTRDAAADFVAGEAESVQTDDPVQLLAGGGIPGEDILVRRMIWEIIIKNGYEDHVDEEQVIVFHRDDEGLRSTAYLSGLFGDQMTAPNSGTLVHYAESPDSSMSFSLPTAELSPVEIGNAGYLSALPAPNHVGPGDGVNSWHILLANELPPGVRGASSWQVLKGALVLQRVLALNKDLPLTLEAFRAGRQMVVPSFEDLEARYHVVDLETARYFYEIVQYYDRFETVFNEELNAARQMMAGD